jgi:hypothetical protein
VSATKRAAVKLRRAFTCSALHQQQPEQKIGRA